MRSIEHGVPSVVLGGGTAVGGRWCVKLQGGPADVDRLKALLSRDPSPPWTIDVDPDGQPCLDSKLFDGLDAHGVLREAQRALSRLNGFARVHHRAYASLQAGGVYFIHPDGRRDAFMFAQGAVVLCDFTFSATATVSGPDGKAIPPPPPLLTSLAGEDAGPEDRTLARALELFATADPNWSTLYCVFEVIQASCRELASWSTDAERRQFGAAANHPAVSGTAARHAIQKGPAPGGPHMSFNDGLSLIRRLLMRWIDLRCVQLTEAAKKGG